MPNYRQPVQEYMRACEALLNINELSNEEAEAVEAIFGQIADKFLDGPQQPVSQSMAQQSPPL